MIVPEWSKMMYDKISVSLPKHYTDRKGQMWRFVSAPKYIMYAKVNTSQQFTIHTDTGCEYDDMCNLYSKFTVLTYLNDDFSGGETQFYSPTFEKTAVISPKTNRTLIFDIDLFHSGEMVTSGCKYWIGTELVASKMA
jgi:hypothetical protein